ncbi:MAG TPA: sulfite exporter TauE/SafE family protein [Planctomycetaceae bacterium]|nr:sulfite exporter TauE/SafE family protein [Planctomycetaceae bacterium]
MTSAKAILFVLLGGVAVIFCAVWVADLIANKGRLRPNGFHFVVGFITDFFDTLGIGSYATTTSLYRLRRAVADEEIPGTLNVGHAIPTVVQAFIYITIVQVEMKTLALLIGASVLGAWLGASIVTRWPRRRIQIGMGVALLAAVTLMLGGLLNVLPAGGTATHLDGIPLYAALVGNFWLGALMTIGIGAYAPIMIMVSLFGMNPKAAFPIMMGSCAFLMPIAGIRFIRSGKYDPRAALGLSIAGTPAVLLAAFIVKEMPLDVIRWLVVVVVLYAAISMLWTARVERREFTNRDLINPIETEI